MNCPSSHSLFLRSNGSLVCWDDRGQLKELQQFDADIDYGNDVYLGKPYNHIRHRLDKGLMPFPEYCSNCCVMMTDHARDDLASRRVIETFQIEPSMGCQLDCPGCIKRSERSTWVPRRASGHMTLKPEVLYKIVLDLKAAGISVRKFDMQGSGEPLLNKRIWEMCGFLAEHYPNAVRSICTHSNADFRPEMVLSGVNEILFSIDGVDQASYAPWRIGGDFERALQFMRSFSVEAHEAAPHINRVWKYVLFDYNDSDEQLATALRYATECKITTLRFVVTQLGQASKRIFEIDDLPIRSPDGGPQIVIDSYLITIPQLTTGLERFKEYVRKGDLALAQTWADFVAHSIYRLFNSRPGVAEKHVNILKTFLEITANLPADRFGRYDRMMIRSVAAASGYISGFRSTMPPPLLTDSRQIRKATGGPLPVPATFAKVVDMRKYLHDVEVDETFYLSRYPDVAQAVADGLCPSATEHYRNFGYCEGRLPAEPLVDSSWYLSNYEDVRRAHEARQLQSIDGHFIEFGYREGRSGSPPQ